MIKLTREVLILQLRDIIKARFRTGSDAERFLLGDVRHVVWPANLGPRSKDKRPGWDRMLAWLDKLGYEVKFEIVRKGNGHGQEAQEVIRAGASPADARRGAGDHPPPP